MQCQWDTLYTILPLWLRAELDNYDKENLQELRLRVQRPVELVYGVKKRFINREVRRDDISFTINTASKYSPWSAKTINNGYITAPGGHRIGIGGYVVYQNGRPSGIRSPTSVCIRVSKNYDGIAKSVAHISGSTIIIGPPGCGKTTFLRDFIRQKSNSGTPVSVIDERSEIFPEIDGQFCFPVGKHTDVLSGCSKAYGIETLIRCMSPAMIAVDEITAVEDCEALKYAGWCGVSLTATAHAGCRNDLLSRPVYRPLLDLGLFENILIINPNKSWSLERM